MKTLKSQYLKAANLNKQLIIHAKDKEIEELKKSEMTEQKANSIAGNQAIDRNEKGIFTYFESGHEVYLEQLKAIVYLMENHK